MQFLPTLIALIAILIVYTIKLLLTRWRRRRIIKKAGCQPIVKYPAREPFGKDYDREQRQAILDGRLNDFARERYEKCGSTTYSLQTLEEHVIHSMEPLNHQALATRLDDWVKEDRRAAQGFFGVGILQQNGAAWRRTRDMVNPLFKRAELSDIGHFKVFVDRWMHLLPRDGSEFDAQPLIRKLFLDSATDFIFGTPIGCLEDTTSKSEEFISAFDRATAGAGKRVRITGFYNQIRLAFTRDEKWMVDCKVIHDFIDDCIVRHRSAEKPTSDGRRRYILIEGMSKEIADPIALRSQLLSIFSLARETPAVAFSNILFLLARNPDVWANLRKEAATLDEKDPITPEILKRLPLFRNTVLETFRLHSPVTRNRRLAARDTVLPRGGGPDGSAPAFVPKGTLVWIDKFPSSRDTKIWGTDVEAFRPSRFEGRRSTGWEFTPFSGGPRMCPANQQVMSQCVYLLYRIVREFETIENRDPCQRYVEGIMMCFNSKNGCRISLKP